MQLQNLPPPFRERYTLIERLGEGGMGELYLARDKQLNRSVAIKFILGCDDLVALKRFHREAAIQLRLDHPGIADVFDFSKGPLPYITFEYIEGQNLWQYLSQSAPLPLEEVSWRMAAICEAVAHAHRLGILHRDLKSENIMLFENGQMKIIDFGLARRSDLTSTLTKTGVILGTPAYMAPELIKGDEASVQSDVYAAGVIMYEMLTGEQPFTGDTPVALMMKRLQKPPPDPRKLRQEIDDDFAAINLRALAKEAEDRFVSFDEMFNDLSRWRAGESLGGNETVAVPVVDVSSKGMTTTKNNRPVPPEEVAEEAGSSDKKLTWMGLFFFLLVIFAAFFLLVQDEDQKWINSIRLQVTANRCVLRWQTEKARTFTYSIVAKDTKKRIARLKEGKKEKKHEVVISGLNPNQSYELVLSGDGKSVSRSFSTSAVTLVRGVHVSATKSTFFADFQATIGDGLRLVIEGSDGTKLAESKCKGEGPFLIDLPANVPHGELSWSLGYGKSILANGRLKVGLQPFTPPYLKYARQLSNKLVPFHSWGRSLLWHNEQVFITSGNGALASFKLTRTSSAKREKRDTLELAWLFHCNEIGNVGSRNATGGMTILPDGRLFAIFRNRFLRILSPPKRAQLWQKRVGNSSPNRVPSWFNDMKDSWYGPITGGELFLPYKPNVPEGTHVGAGVYHNGYVYFLGDNKEGMRIVAYNVDSIKIRNFERLRNRRLNEGRIFKGSLHHKTDMRNWWPIGHLVYCQGRLFCLMRSKFRQHNVTGPYEYVLTSWSCETGESSVDLHFANYCNVVSPGVDEQNGLVWNLSISKLHRLEVYKSQVKTLKNYEMAKIESHEGILSGGVLAVGQDIYFTQHETLRGLAFGSAIAQGEPDGYFYLCHFNDKTKNAKRYREPTRLKVDAARGGAYRHFALLNGVIVAYNYDRLVAVQPKEERLSLRGALAFPDRKYDETLANWAVSANGYLAVVAFKGKLFVTPYQLVLYNKDRN